MTFLESRNNRIIFMLCITISQPIFFWYTFKIMMNAVRSNFHFSVLNQTFTLITFYVTLRRRYKDSVILPCGCHQMFIVVYSIVGKFWSLPCMSNPLLCFGNVLGLLELLQMLSDEKFLEKKGGNLFFWCHRVHPSCVPARKPQVPCTIAINLFEWMEV